VSSSSSTLLAGPHPVLEKRAELFCLVLSMDLRKPVTQDLKAGNRRVSLKSVGVQGDFGHFGRRRSTPTLVSDDY